MEKNKEMLVNKFHDEIVNAEDVSFSFNIISVALETDFKSKKNHLNQNQVISLNNAKKVLKKAYPIVKYIKCSHLAKVTLVLSIGYMLFGPTNCWAKDPADIVKGMGEMKDTPMSDAQMAWLNGRFSRHSVEWLIKPSSISDFINLTYPIKKLNSKFYLPAPGNLKESLIIAGVGTGILLALHVYDTYFDQ